MQKLADEVLDFYDDPTGVVFKKRFPVKEALPDYIKEAKLLSPEERDSLPEDLFALVLQEEDRSIRKYAMNDKAHTTLSVVYFLDNGAQKLPEVFAKTAAHNLIQGCLWYSIEPPEALTKIAEGPLGLDAFVDSRVNSEKVAAIPPVPVHHAMALPSQDKYPIDSYRDTMNAVEFFDKHASRFHPRDRREYSRNLTKRANELGIPVTQDLQLYASEAGAPQGQVAGQIQLRMEKTSGDHRQRYALFFQKIASVEPGAAAEALAELDRMSGLDDLWDSRLLDPYATMLQEKTAQEYAFHDSHGSISDEDIHKLVGSQQDLIKRALGDDMYSALKEDPVAVFKSLPLQEKRVLMRLKSSEQFSDES